MVTLELVNQVIKGEVPKHKEKSAEVYAITQALRLAKDKKPKKVLPIAEEFFKYCV